MLYIILEDLMKNTLHPRRVVRFLGLGGDIKRNLK